ncbi:hypothetical protein PC121_g17001 [Phytophthora cactorum]|nr:hypothetical protein PC120_g19732 [Phytophthora cactorum]KAG3053043.1 hypothetical protein PC121_g17001 [Phytophthora cactorum]KAG4041548.1 hypothetical protein PC123_g22943 [Phytophthora cactorum]
MHDLETWHQAKAAVTLKISETAEDSAAHRFADDTAARYQCSEPLRSRHSLKSSQDLPISTSPSAPNAIILSGVEATTVHRAPVF